MGRDREPETEIKRIRPFLLVHDRKTHTYEICAQIDVNYTVVKEERPPTEEYQELFWLPKAEMKVFIRNMVASLSLSRSICGMSQAFLVCEALENLKDS